LYGLKNKLKLDKASYKEYNINKLRNERRKEMMYEEMEVGMEMVGCVGCPYAEECEALELFWGCAVWEDEMGEDL